MSDYERYGDYNEIEEDQPKSKNPVIITLKILIAVVCIGVVGIIAFRLILFNSYPETVKNLYFNDTLTDYYNEVGDGMDIKTQDLRAPYDDPDLGNFFCDYLYVIDDIGQLQITVRYNTASVDRIAEELGLSLDENDPTIFTYRIADNYGRIYDEVNVAAFESQMMYRYAKLVFDGVKFDPEDGKLPEWIRLEVFVGEDSEKPYSMVPIYENNENYAKFDEYKPSRKELP